MRRDVSVYIKEGQIDRFETCNWNLNLTQSKIGKVIDMIKTMVVNGHCCWVKNRLAGGGHLAAWNAGTMVPRPGLSPTALD